MSSTRNDQEKILQNAILEMLEDLKKEKDPVTKGNTEEQIKINFLTLLRFFPFESTLLFVKQQMTETLSQLYEEAKKEFLLFSPFISRYSTQTDLENLETSYERSIDSDLKEKSIKDREYGMKRREWAENILKILKDNPLSLASTCLVEVGRLLRETTDPKDQFGVLRGKELGSETRMLDRYAWGIDLVESILAHSQSSGMIYDESHTINLIYGNDLNPTTIGIYYPFWKGWSHGRVSLNETLPFIERLTEKLWNMDLSEKNRENMTEFYSSLAELLWLIGNTQPYFRGSGTLAEIMFGIMHIHHGIDPPVLKLEFPQIDVLDISFPVSDYKQFFTSFFEPSSLHECLRTEEDTAIATLPRKEQLQKMYARINRTEMDAKNDIHFTDKPAAFFDPAQRQAAKSGETAKNDSDEPAPITRLNFLASWYKHRL